MFSFRRNYWPTFRHHCIKWTKLKVVEVEPTDKVLKKYIERYQFFEAAEPLLVKAVPTGTLECWIKLDGHFEIFDPRKEVFKPSGRSGIFPMGSELCVYFVPKEIKCVNIKMKPQVLALPSFKHLFPDWERFSANQFFGDQGLEVIKTFDLSSFNNSAVIIDSIIRENNDFESVDAKVESILMSMTSAKDQRMKISDIANENNLTVKSLERLIKKTFGMTPKKLVSILRFGNSIKYLNKSEGHRFIDALQFGYYDQSHFIRECRRLTGMNPKEFLSKLLLTTNDLVSAEFSE